MDVRIYEFLVRFCTLQHFTSMLLFTRVATIFLLPAPRGEEVGGNKIFDCLFPFSARSPSFLKISFLFSCSTAT
jgi:hypothetical protein